MSPTPQGTPASGSAPLEDELPLELRAPEDEPEAAPVLLLWVPPEDPAAPVELPPPDWPAELLPEDAPPLPVVVLDVVPPGPPQAASRNARRTLSFSLTPKGR